MDFVSPMVFRAIPLTSKRCRRHNADFGSPIIFRAISLGITRNTVCERSPIIFYAIPLRNTRDAVCGLWISRRQWYFSKFCWEFPLRTADFALSMMFCAVKLRNTRNAVSKPRFPRCLRCFAQFHLKKREMLPPNCGFRVVSRLSRNFVEIRETPTPNYGFHVSSGISRNFIEI